MKLFCICAAYIWSKHQTANNRRTSNTGRVISEQRTTTTHPQKSIKSIFMNYLTHKLFSLYVYVTILVDLTKLFKYSIVSPILITLTQNYFCDVFDGNFQTLLTRYPGFASVIQQKLLELKVWPNMSYQTKKGPILT